MSGQSFQRLDVAPSAILSNGLVTIPLHAVSTLQLSHSYQLPSNNGEQHTALATRDDSLSLSALLVGPERFALKLALEGLAELGRSAATTRRLTVGLSSGLILVTSLAVRTDMRLQSLSFSVSAGRRDVIDVSMTLVHAPQPGLLAQLLEPASLGVRALSDITGGL